MLNLFYEEPEVDRWFWFDRHPRRLIRRIVRGKSRPGGQTRMFLNLCAGLERLQIKFRINDYRYIQRHCDEIACIIGKPHVLNKIQWRNRIVFGAAVYSHPLNDIELLNRLPIETVLVPGQWMRVMCEPFWGRKVTAWPVGIDTEKWKKIGIHESEDNEMPADCYNTKVQKLQLGKNNFNRSFEKNINIKDILIYDKIRWEHDYYENQLILPIRSELEKRNLSFAEIRYGFYNEDDFQHLLQQCRAMIFLCEHETQGLAYQQALSCGVPILAWDRGGFWQDPEFYPHRIKFQPVSSVPYWDDRCGIKFQHVTEFSEKLNQFMDYLMKGMFQPRNFILENLTLEKCARDYVAIIENLNC